MSSAELVGWAALTGGACTALHAAAAWWLMRGLRRPLPSARERPPISVVVAARDEAAAIEGVVRAVLEQDYPAEIELVVVDDRSTDDTAAKVRLHTETRRAGRRVRLLRVDTPPPGVSPKKHALTLGAAHASHDILAFTDGDTRPERTWLAALAEHLEEGVGLVIGPAPIDGRGLSGRLASFEALGLYAVAAGSAGAGYPLTCTGRNLLYRRAALDDAGGFAGSAELAAGDDDLLLGRVRDRTAWSIVHARSAAARVRSTAPPSARAWIAQQRRHGSNSLRFAPPIVAGLLLLYLYHLLPLALLAAALSGLAPMAGLGGAAALWGARAALDGALLRRAAAGIGERPPGPAVLPAEALFSLMVAVVAPLGILAGYSWKGEPYPQGKVPPKPNARTAD